MKTRVIFEYDEVCHKWEVLVEGVKDTTESLEAFVAVLITCQQATPSINHNKSELQENGQYKLSIGI